MDLMSASQLLGNFGEFIAAIGVVASLMFVGLQIRQSTKATRAQTHQAVTQSILTVGSLVSMRPEVFGTSCQSRDSLENLSPGDATFFLSAMFGMFKYFELMFVQHKEGSIDGESWTAWSQHILMYFHQPGVQSWWALRRGAFTQSFQQYLEGSAPPEMRSMADLLHRST
jgi:hypothetical protein